jgi:rare lipoprotein A
MAWAAAGCVLVGVSCGGSSPPATSVEAQHYAQASKPVPCVSTTEAPQAASSAPVAAAPTALKEAAPPRKTIAANEADLLARYEGKSAKQVLTGKATYYGNSLAGNKTASGDVYDPKRFTAAHRKLPFGTVVRVIRTDTNQYVYVTITDRGPFAGGGRIIDLSYIAAERLGMLRAGVVPVRVEVLP